MNNNLHQQLDMSTGNTANDLFSFISKRPGKGRLVHKTSAEIVSEAKNMLTGGGTRLVSARRPITPNEPRRQLYGGMAPPGRPPSAINLKYLQQGTHMLPILEPINTRGSISCGLTRSESIDEIIINEPNGKERSIAPLATREKLPALNCLPKKERLLDIYHQSLQEKCQILLPIKISSKLGTQKKDNTDFNSIVKNHPLKRRQVKSFDEQDTLQLKAGQQNIFGDQLKLVGRSDLLVQSSTESLLEMLKEYEGVKECDASTVARINEILNEIYRRMKGSKASWRGAVLGALYGLVESSSPRILLSVACVVFAMNVTGSNLTGACKLVYKIARNEHNDNLFMESDVPELLVEGLGRASPVDDAEACIYGYGAVRFLASSISESTNDNGISNHGIFCQRSLAFRLAKHGLGQLMVLHLKILNETAVAGGLSGSPLHALFQLSGAMRILAGTQIPLSQQFCNPIFHSKVSQEEQESIQIEQTVQLLMRAAEICIDEPEVLTNIIRTLSVLSERSDCGERLVDTAPRLGILLGSILKTNSTVEKNLATSNRLGYILGNIMTCWDSARLQFYKCDVSLNALFEAMDYYAKRNVLLNNQMGDSIVQVLTKLIRVIANMCVNGEVGYGMSKRSSWGEILLILLLKVKNPETTELKELLFAILGTLHNLSYYYEDDETCVTSLLPPGSMRKHLKDICGALCAMLQDENNPGRSEVARVLGNMTRTASIRQTFCEENGIEILIRCLTSTDNELIVTSCGVMVNILGDRNQRDGFSDMEGPVILRGVLQRGVANRNWIMAGIACQAIWNYLIDSCDIIDCLGQDETDLICENLADALDEENLFKGQTPDNFWDDFATVGTDLLERLQICISGRNTPFEEIGGQMHESTALNMKWRCKPNFEK